MQLPFFYIASYQNGQQMLTLNEENSRHAVQVLRMKKGDMLHLTDGKGNLITAAITNDHKKNCEVSVNNLVREEKTGHQLTIAISLIKNASRFEWFLEKATELGVHAIVPLICERTEKQKSKEERWHNILVSAMLQSRQTWLPQLASLISFTDFLKSKFSPDAASKLIAHCIDDKKQQISVGYGSNTTIMIGPEGDFTSFEIAMALSNGYTAVTLGNTRLRTETAGITAAAAFAVTY